MIATKKPLALICGNGLSLSFSLHCKTAIDPSRPFSWPLKDPNADIPLLDYLTPLKTWLANVKCGSGRDFALVREFSRKMRPSVFEAEIAGDDLAIHQCLRHYLALAYSWFYLQLKTHSVLNWYWHEWLCENRRHLGAVLSWNYDLVLERLFKLNRIRYQYAGTGTDPQGGTRLHVRQEPPIPLFKPHGSCNLGPASNISIGASAYDGGPLEPVLPANAIVANYEGPMRIIPDSDLYSFRSVADIVLPGEWNYLSRFTRWKLKGFWEYIGGMAGITHLVIVGFHMDEADRPEFESVLHELPTFNHVEVVDPNPNPELITILERKSHKLSASQYRPTLAVR